MAGLKFEINIIQTFIDFEEARGFLAPFMIAQLKTTFEKFGNGFGLLGFGMETLHKLLLMGGEPTYSFSLKGIIDEAFYKQ